MSEVIIYVASSLIRIVLLVYGEWQDSNMEVKFTDVDYFVFSDAAEFVASGESPYRRATYRYSPILAWILVPNAYVHKAWGKVLFITFDFLTAHLIKKILCLLSCDKKLIKFALCLWLFNPITMTVSCRGNAESVLSALVLGILFALLKKKVMLTGILFAVAVHLKIYPVIYTLCLLMFLGGNCYQCKGEVLLKDLPGLFMFKIDGWKKLLSVERIKFIASSLVCFSALFGIMFLLYGYDFIEHTYLYHVSRRDVKHNFSIYFYMLYIDNSPYLSALCFLNQFLVIFCASYINYEDPPFCFFLLTYAFVTFNKVCTSQYFLWYLTLLPLLVFGLGHVSAKKLILPAGMWFIGQALWLYPAYMLEFVGLNVFSYLWSSSVTFFIFNAILVEWFVGTYRFKPIFNRNGHFNATSKKIS